MTQPIRGRWFDGHSSQARPVLVTLHGAPSGKRLRLHELAGSRRTLELGGREVGWPQTWSSDRTPRTLAIDLRQHGSLEVDDAAQWQAALAAAGDRPALVQRMQTRWPVFLLVLLAAAAALAAFYRWGTPWAATQVTRQVPLEWEVALSKRALQDMDQEWLKPSQLAAARQEQLRRRFETLARQFDPGLQRYRGYSPRLSLQFRSGLGANAFALPGGAIVITDDLVEAAGEQALGEDALMGVLAHEIGHVVHRHTTRMVVEQAVLNVGLGLALGDVSSLLSVGGSFLTGMAYRRGHESEADCFAAALLGRAKVPTGPMADLLLRMEREREQTAPSRHADSGSAVAGLLSSHPATGERARQLRQGRLQGCPSK